MNKLQETREMRRKNNKGFSLVELIIVIAIMAVLVAILAPAFMRYVEESRQKADITAVDEVIQSVKAAYTNSEFEISGTTTIELSKGANPVITPEGGDLANALKNSDVDEAQFKSSKWGKVTLELKEATTGALDVVISETGFKDNVKMSEKYNK